MFWFYFLLSLSLWSSIWWAAISLALLNIPYKVKNHYIGKGIFLLRDGLSLWKQQRFVISWGVHHTDSSLLILAVYWRDFIAFKLFFQVLNHSFLHTLLINSRVGISRHFQSGFGLNLCCFFGNQITPLTSRNAVMTWNLLKDENFCFCNFCTCTKFEVFCILLLPILSYPEYIIHT